MQRSPLHSPPSSLPSSPVLKATVSYNSVPFVAPLDHAEPQASQRRLLIPEVRPTRSPPQRMSKSKGGILSRPNRSGSITSEISSQAKKSWVSSLGRLCIVQERLQLRGYQMVVVRSRFVNTVCVYTGNPNHRINVTALSPITSLSETEAQAEMDNILHMLRRDGARPKETEHGIILITSLANFRSDYNLILIPDGNFSAAREQLYVNINLLRMGCSGRSALTLSEPSEPTKDRFMHMFCFSESLLTTVTFNHIVLELVKLVQSSLALFGIFDCSHEERNGLLCDVTAEGILRWTDEIGEPLLSLEPMERVGDPSFVSALFSLVVSLRNKLQALGFSQVPKDPFRDLQSFMQTVMTVKAQKAQPQASPFLSLEIIEAINNMYDRSKSKGSEYRVPRIILNKLDDITTDLNLRHDSSFSTPIYATADLANFVGIIVGAGPKDTVGSLKALWTGKSKRRKAKKDGIDDEVSDGKSSDDDEITPSIFPNWGKHMKNFDFGLGRSKKPSIDLTRIPRIQSFSADEAPTPSRTLPQSTTPGESGAEGLTPSPFMISPAHSPHSSKVNLLNVNSAIAPRYAGIPTRIPPRSNTLSEPFRLPKTERQSPLRRSSTYENRKGEGTESPEDERRANRTLLLSSTRRRHSAEDLSKLRRIDRVPLERLKIDVGLCGQYLIMKRREQHLQNVISFLEYFNSSLRASSTRFRTDMESSAPLLQETLEMGDQVWSKLDEVEARLVRWGRMQDLLSYQIEQLDVRPLWKNVKQQRARTLAVRQTIFAAPPGTRPHDGAASPRYFRAQATLNSEEQRLVDWLGRTESEAEEEATIPPEEVGRPPPFEELQAWAAATAPDKEKKKRTKTWWWPFGQKDPASDDETTGTQSATVVEER
ncbi:hypothetical protein Clacol_001669 [Clathrus columnatus]|uniref:STB6-like N-terminal domain-containing protein n=1 Tax=Clathrus columnatus TaxID=1419009 RepID=A0AAV5A208_9AGAM|nr:hypothetical protein Clacol_001669 [Clathrus columnatus]